MLEPNHYWKPPKRAIQMAALYIISQQPGQPVYVKRAEHTYLREVVLNVGGLLLARGEHLSEYQLRAHIRWAFFFAEPLVRERYPGAEVVFLPNLNWVKEFQEHHRARYSAVDKL